MSIYHYTTSILYIYILLYIIIVVCITVWVGVVKPTPAQPPETSVVKSYNLIFLEKIGDHTKPQSPKGAQYEPALFYNTLLFFIIFNYK